ncbi:integrase family protein [Methylotuvimicrobium sp. KM2]|uniref:tyrosine-type recombinase/integrase n=1 Tax=Methylotuvimicrobium sp. KM2 TaxID=3133976 RepID=UPI0031018280
MANKINFTQQRIEKLKAPENGRVDYHDTGFPKLICRVSSTGVKTFAVLKWDGRTSKRVTLGRFPDLSVADARKLAGEALSSLANGIDPVEEKRKERLSGMTLSELLESYLKNKNDLREASILDYRKKINQGFADWLDKPINTITRDMVLVKRNGFKGARDNKLRVLRVLMNYATKTLKAIDNNPVDILTDGKLWARPKRRKRMIGSDDMKAWYEAVLGLDNEKAKLYLLLLLHTGLRDQDVRYLEWLDVDFKNDSFLVRDTKNHTDFTAYIAPQIKPYLRGLQALTGDSRFVFPGESGDGVMNQPRKQIKKVIDQSGVEFSPHDLKRTFLTIGEAAMIPFSLLKALANHKTDNDVTGGYINPESKTMKAATFKIADYIEQHVLSSDENVVTLKRSLTQ